MNQKKMYRVQPDDYDIASSGIPLHMMQWYVDQIVGQYSDYKIVNMCDSGLINPKPISDALLRVIARAYHPMKHLVSKNEDIVSAMKTLKQYGGYLCDYTDPEYRKRMRPRRGS